MRKVEEIKLGRQRLEVGKLARFWDGLEREKEGRKGKTCGLLSMKKINNKGLLTR